MPSVLKLERDGVPDNAIYVGRGTPWGNPYHVGRDGTREQVIEKFCTYARARYDLQPNWLDRLRGRDLVCHCAPQACHADVLLELLNDD